jgi:transposase-like protein
LVLTIEAQPVPMEFVPGPTGRRRWTDAQKAAIVAESFEPGVSVAEVADECCPRAVVDALREAGNDVRYAAETDA